VRLLSRTKQRSDVYDRDADLMTVALSMVRRRWSYSDFARELLNPRNGLSAKLRAKGQVATHRELVRTWNRSVDLVREAERIEQRARAGISQLRRPARAGGHDLPVVAWALDQAVANSTSSALTWDGSRVTFSIATCRTVAEALGTSIRPCTGSRCAFVRTASWPLSSSPGGPPRTRRCGALKRPGIDGGSEPTGRWADASTFSRRGGKS